MTKTLILAFAFAALAYPAVASPNDHQHHDENHDHLAHDHEEGHRHQDDTLDDAPTDRSAAILTRTAEIDAALAAGGEPIVIDILGVVCDFCAKAMNKTFSKRAEVASTYVDLDTKALSLVLRPEATLGDEMITTLVKKAGYRTAAIRRGEAALRGGDNADDAS